MALAAMLLLSIFLSGAISEAVYDRLVFCGRVIIPALFVSMTVSLLVCDIRMPSRISGRMRAAVLLSVCALCGSPTCAATAKRLYDSGKADRISASRMCACSGSVSASFMLGYVASVSKGGVYHALACLAAQYIVLAAAYMLMPFEIGKDIPRNKKSAVSAVKDAGRGCLDACALITAFSCVPMIAERYIPMSDGLSAAVKGIFEFSSGVTASGGNAVLIGALCGFGGICVIAQVKGLLGDEISVLPFVAVRIVSCAAVCAVSLFFA